LQWLTQMLEIVPPPYIDYLNDGHHHDHQEEHLYHYDLHKYHHHHGIRDNLGSSTT
jgi:hypothetical protein